MARLVAAFGTSHSVMLAAQLEDWLAGFRTSDQRMPFYDREGKKLNYNELLTRAPASRSAALCTNERLTSSFHATQEAMTRMKNEIAAAKLDVLIIVGDDQHELFQDQHMPSIGIYHGETIRNAARDGRNKEAAPEQWYTRAQMQRLEENGDVHYPCYPKLGRYLIEGLIDNDFDISAIGSLLPTQYEGHAYSFVHRWYLKDTKLPVVPIFLNTYNPPNTPRPARCVRLGSAIRELVAKYPEDLRIGIIGSGGLSHFICEEELDRPIIDAFRNKDLDFLSKLDPQWLKAGSSEIRNWIVTAAAATDLDLDWVSYIPVYRTPALSGIGLCFAKWK
jgi:3-O-methylgallate 3,4-dioxygenase